MFTRRWRYSPFSSLRRPAHLSALFVVIGLPYAALNALPTFAMPTDPIDPPDFEGNPEYVASAGASRCAEALAPAASDSGIIAYVQPLDTRHPRHLA